MQGYIPQDGWTVIKNRPQGGLIEFDGQNYRKSGPTIQDEIARQQELAVLDFPVPTLLETGDDSYIEQALTGRTLIDESPDTAVQNFYEYKSVLERLLVSQVTHPVAPDTDSLRQGIHFDSVVAENPELERMFSLETVFEAIVEQAAARSWTRAHGDLSPTNIFQDGIIDWEFGFTGPAGYDLLSLSASPLLYGPNQRSRVDAGLMRKLVGQVGQEFGVDALQDFEAAALVMKSVFYLSHMRQATIDRPHKRELWFRRKNTLRYLAESMLAGSAVDYAALASMSGNYLEGAAARVRNQHGELLVVNYSDDLESPWHMPGGELETIDGQPETAPEAALRELQEEVGLSATSPARVEEAKEVTAYLLKTPYDAGDGQRYYGKYKIVVDIDYQGVPDLYADGEEVRRAAWVSPEKLATLPMVGDEKQILLAAAGK